MNNLVLLSCIELMQREIDKFVIQSQSVAAVQCVISFFLAAHKLGGDCLHSGGSS